MASSSKDGHQESRSVPEGTVARASSPLSHVSLLLPQAIKVKLLVLLGAALLTFLLSIIFSNLKHITEEKFGALGWTLFPSLNVEERLTIVAIDERSLAEVGPWPWPREVLAELSNRLNQAGAAMQLFDIVLPEPKEGDELLLEALSGTSSILGQIPVLTQSAGNNLAPIQSGKMTGFVAGVNCQGPLPSAIGYLANHQGFSSIAKGHITPVVDNDGLIRKQPPLICVNGRAYPSLSLQALLQGFSSGVGSGRLVPELVAGHGVMDPAWYIQLKGYLGYQIPLDSSGNVRISYHQHPSVFRVVSAADILSVPASDPLLQDLVKDAWVLVGATAFGLGDVVPTPHSGMAPGVELQARLLLSMLDGSVPYTPAMATWLLLLECVFFAVILLWLGSSPGLRSIVGLPAAGVMLPLLALLVHSQLLHVGIWLGWLAPAVFGLLAAVMMSLLEHKRVRLERQRVFGNLSSYLPAEAAREIAFNLPSGAIEANRREVVLLCADLRNFSTYESTHSPEEAAALLHCFFVRAADVVGRCGGAVEEFTGDSVLASWGIDSTENASLKAFQAAKELQKVMEAIMPSPIALGVSVEKGPVLVGSIGPAHRRTHTMLGDTVTLTLRIQEMTEELAQPILVGECAARDLRGEGLTSQGAFLLNGLKAPQVIYAPGYIEPAEPLIEDFVPCDLSSEDRAGGESSFRVIPGGKE